ncbi:GAF domain-containing protein [Aquabacter cavernae]|uniref:GAF domain-containing protein n=1 Tax=Aquabacter cavernae TaxID=2496029 RepID=UPI000F8E6DE4|nr:GAF domain-containing protein [Aquabacter cavernae]
MEKILIVDDHAVNREFLSTVLKHGGFTIAEALDGWSALEAARADRPDLIISDILMPSGDGYELVQALRRDPALAEVPVVFYTAHFNEREALSLARACGVKYVLTKPAEPEEVLRVVRMLLAGAAGAGTAGEEAEQTAERQYMRLVADKLVQTADELEWTTSRLMALIEMCLQITSEREPGQLVKTFCRWTRDLVAARHAVVGLWEPGAPAAGHVAVSGLSDEAAAAVEAGLTNAMPHPVPLSATGPLRRSGPVSDADDLGLPWAYPPVGAMLVIPVRSPTRQYGWVCATSRISGDAFTSDDERLLTIFASYLGRIFENHCLLSELSDHARQLETEVTRRSASQWSAEMQRAVTSALAQAASPQDGAGRMLEAICTKGGFALGELWEVPPGEDRLAHVATWHAAPGPVEDFLAQTKAMMFEPGHGLPGRVWRAGIPVWVPDVETEPSYLRTAAAVAAGLRSAVAFPVTARGRVRGVICLFGNFVRPPDTDLIGLFDAIGGQAGQLLERYRLEVQVEALIRERALLAQVAALTGREETLADLFERACWIAVETGGFALAQVRGMDEQGRIKTLAIAGFETREPTLADGGGLVPGVFATGAPAVDNSCGFTRPGDGACAALPVMLKGRVRAVLVLHADASGFFSPPALETAKQMAGSLALALDALEGRGSAAHV